MHATHPTHPAVPRRRPTSTPTEPHRLSRSRVPPPPPPPPLRIGCAAAGRTRYIRLVCAPEFTLRRPPRASQPTSHIRRHARLGERARCLLAPLRRRRGPCLQRPTATEPEVRPASSTVSGGERQHGDARGQPHGQPLGDGDGRAQTHQRDGARRTRGPGHLCRCEDAGAAGAGKEEESVLRRRLCVAGAHLVGPRARHQRVDGHGGHQDQCHRRSSPQTATTSTC